MASGKLQFPDDEGLESLLGDYGNKPDWWISDDDHPALRKDPSLDLPWLEDLMHDLAITPETPALPPGVKKMTLEETETKKDYVELSLSMNGSLTFRLGDESTITRRLILE
jgi:hypothetical protein